VLVLLDQFELHASEAGDGQQGENQSPRPSGQIGFYLRLHLEGHGGHDRGQGDHAPPDPARQFGGAFVYRTVRFQLHP